MLNRGLKDNCENWFPRGCITEKREVLRRLIKNLQVKSENNKEEKEDQVDSKEEQDDSSDIIPESPSPFKIIPKENSSQESTTSSVYYSDEDPFAKAPSPASFEKNERVEEEDEIGSFAFAASPETCKSTTKDEPHAKRSRIDIG